MKSMAPLKGIVRLGRVVVEGRVDYEDGTELELEVIEPTSTEELAELDAALAESKAQTDAGQICSAEAFSESCVTSSERV